MPNCNTTSMSGCEAQCLVLLKTIMKFAARVDCGTLTLYLYLLQDYAPVVKQAAYDTAQKTKETATDVAAAVPGYASAAYDKTVEGAQVAAQKAQKVAAPLAAAGQDYATVAANKAAVQTQLCSGELGVHGYTLHLSPSCCFTLSLLCLACLLCLFCFCFVPLLSKCSSELFPS
jgi:hypothetical protein